MKYTTQCKFKLFSAVIRLWNRRLGFSSPLFRSPSLSLTFSIEFWHISSFLSLPAWSKIENHSRTGIDANSFDITLLYRNSNELTMINFLKKANSRRSDKIKNQKKKRKSLQEINKMCDLMWPNHAGAISYKIMVKFQNHRLNCSLSFCLFVWVRYLCVFNLVRKMLLSLHWQMVVCLHAFTHLVAFHPHIKIEIPFVWRIIYYSNWIFWLDFIFFTFFSFSLSLIHLIYFYFVEKPQITTLLNKLKSRWCWLLLFVVVIMMMKSVWVFCCEKAKWRESGQTKSIVQFIDKRLLFHRFMIPI